MKTKLLNAVTLAITHYTSKHNRGYRVGIFTNWRHSFTKTPNIIALESDLLSCPEDELALQIVVEHLLAKSATFNHHSFNSYLIDALKLHVPTIDWDCFTPCAVKTFRGTVYRGTSQPPEKIFAEGFNDRSPSDYIEDYVKFQNGNVGTSTSKDFECAYDYATNNKRSGSQRFIYSINYRDSHGYDVLESGKARGLVDSPEKHCGGAWKKREVNIRHAVAPEDIIGAWKIEANGDLNWIENLRYQHESLAMRM